MGLKMFYMWVFLKVISIHVIHANLTLSNTSLQSFLAYGHHQIFFDAGQSSVWPYGHEVLTEWTSSIRYFLFFSSIPSSNIRDSVQKGKRSIRGTWEINGNIMTLHRTFWRPAGLFEGKCHHIRSWKGHNTSLIGNLSKSHSILCGESSSLRYSLSFNTG